MVSALRPWERLLRPALIAGLVAAAVFDLYLWLTTVLPAGGSLASLWQQIAAVTVGKAVASSSPAYAWLGILIQAAVGIGWAAGYAYLAARQPVFNARWIAAGLVYGIVVYAVMELILLGGNAFTPPATPNAFLNAVIAHTVFFGLPIAYLVKRLQTGT
ncbi:MAG: hypothetical protein WB757_02320 [Candidatus Cybelea sp.]|jgi:hypothetical protein